ncbi:MAG: nucleotidyltransferase family protein [Ruminiclostridium sp.]|nr:nucleotidyltransferase family protein [Ruminiclostridium sp.]
MHTIGIISEYNPFHSGHRYQLEEVRKTFGPDCAIVCAMSGNWVQRGDVAITDKWARAEMALHGGADLVLEIPTLWAASSAETFARGGVSVLDAAGVVDTLCFGSEAGQVEPLQAVVDCLDSPLWRNRLRHHLDKGLSFPAARHKATHDLLGDQADCLRHPNNNLGIEYLRAMKAVGTSMAAYTIRREGAAHDDAQDGEQVHVSASHLRARFAAHDPKPMTPHMRAEDEIEVRADPAFLTECERAILAKLRSMEPKDYALLPDSSEGLCDRLYAAARQARSLEELYDLTKTKRYTHARIRRMVLWAFLGLTEADRPNALPYLRVLGFTERGQQILKQMKTTASLPVIVKPAHISKLSPEAQRVFQLEARCTGMYDLCRYFFQREPGKNEYTENPVRV